MYKFTGVVFVIYILAGCRLTGKETMPPSSGLYIINASPDAPAIDVSLNTETIAGNYAYGKDSGYFFTYPGTYPFKISQSGTSINYIDQLMNFPAGKYYSVFMIDSFSKYKFLFIEDKLSTTVTDSAFVRLLNFSPNSDTVDAIFASTNQDTLAYASRKFNDQGTSGTYLNFTKIPEGSYDLSLYQPDTTILVKDLGQINFDGGKYYTVYLKGLAGNISTPLDTAIIRHN